MNDYGFEPYNELLYSLPFLVDAKVIVETGFGQGGSTQLFLKALSELDNPEERHLYTIEKFMDYPSLPLGRREVKSNIEAMNFKAKWDLIEGDSFDIGRNFRQDFDLLFLDSDHSYETVRDELNTFGMKTKSLIITDDANYPDGRIAPPTPAMIDFSIRNKWRVLHLEENRGLCILKK